MYESTDTARENEREDSADRKAFGLGLLVGAVVGASAALLLAPASGEHTRRNLSRGARRLYTSSGSMAGDLWDSADRSTRQLRKSTSRKVRGGMKRGRRYAEEAADLVETGRRRLGWR